MLTPNSYDYAIIRIVPRVEREEFINVGVILFCRTRRFLAAKLAVDTSRLSAFAPHLDICEIEQHLNLIPLICEGKTKQDIIAQWSQAQRFHWLTAPRSALIQTSAVHCGICHEPAAALEQLLKKMVG